MKSFKEFIVEDNTPKEVHEILNKSQMNALRKHQSYNTYVGGPLVKVYAKPDKDDSGPSYTRNIIMTNAKNKHKMHVAITHRGKILSHSIYKKNEEGNWDHIKTVDGG